MSAYNKYILGKKGVMIKGYKIIFDYRLKEIP